MNCEQASFLIEPCADGELNATEILELEKHFLGCPACAAAVRSARELKKAIKQDALYFTAPTELRQRVKADLRLQVKAEPWWNFGGGNWLAYVATSAVTACLAVLLIVLVTHSSAQQRLTREVVSSHVRSLMADHALDVASTDQHTVKPWFAGKLDFSPPVKDLAPQGFPLVGGRLDYLNGRSVAALIFQRQKHFINLFIWPADAGASEPVALPTQQGFHLVRWNAEGMALWAVSDLNEKELLEFAHSFARAGPIKAR